jgi:hypothetical protein
MYGVRVLAQLKLTPVTIILLDSDTTGELRYATKQRE